ncbi:MAG TPA: DUF1269 domain-containing protein [Ktedonobacteraceae bacterium]|jgi:uncharacterized membrane protein|nr:DUF1269 domain-containing protein [Ktedonobacteraceae bacterium]
MTVFAVLKFPTEEGAERISPILQKLQKQRLIQIEDGMMLTWPQGSEKPRIKRLSQLTGQNVLSETFWGLFVGLLFAVPFFGEETGTTISTLTRHFALYGIDEHFINEVRNKIAEGTSALFLITSRAALDKVVLAVKDTPLEIIPADLSPEQEGLLLKSFMEESLS